MDEPMLTQGGPPTRPVVDATAGLQWARGMDASIDHPDSPERNSQTTGRRSASVFDSYTQVPEHSTDTRVWLGLRLPPREACQPGRFWWMDHAVPPTSTQ